MGIEFRLASTDHGKLEDLLARDAAGVCGIVLDPKTAFRQYATAEAAAQTGAEVYFDPATHRMTAPGFEASTLPYSARGCISVERLKNRPELVGPLVDEVLEAHPPFVTAVTPPYFLIDTPDDHKLNLSLVEHVQARTDRPLRPVVLLSSRFLGSARDVARDYARLGLRSVELRLTPLGGENESLHKLNRARVAADEFTAAGLTVTLGSSGNIGQVFMALGVVDHYSSGIGVAERVDYAAALQRQRRPRKEMNGIARRVYLPGLALTVSDRVASRLLDQPELRTKVGCQAPGCCRRSVKGPLQDPRKHYLNSKSLEVARLLSAPDAWRPRYERERLAAARDLRNEVNRFYANEGDVLLVRTLDALIDHIDATTTGVAAVS